MPNAQKSGVYKILNTITGDFYIGSALDLVKRKGNHFHELRCNKHYNIHLQRAYNKYGESSFVFHTLLFCSKESLIIYEQLCIDGLSPRYNILPKARSMLGTTRTKESKLKQSKSRKGIPWGLGSKWTPERSAKQSVRMTGVKNPNYPKNRKPFSEDYKLKMSARIKLWWAERRDTNSGK